MMGRARERLGRSRATSVDSLYADPTPAPSINFNTRLPNDFEFDLPLRQRIEKHVKARRQSDSVMTNKLVRDWTGSEKGRKAEEEYREHEEQLLRERKEAFQEQIVFAPIKLSHRSLSAPADHTLPPVRRFRRNLEGKLITDELQKFTNLATIPQSTPASGQQTPDEFAIELDEEEGRQRLDLVTKELEKERHRFEQQEEKFFELSLKHHEMDLQHDIDRLRDTVFNLYHYILELEDRTYRNKAGNEMRGPPGCGAYSTEADKMILTTSRYAFLLDRTLLVRHYFRQQVNKLQSHERTNKRLSEVFDAATRQAVELIREGDDYEHSCRHQVDWSCKGCFEHAEHLYKARNNKLHEEVMRLGLYRFEARVRFDVSTSSQQRSQAESNARKEESMWNAKYLFAAVGTELVECRQRIRTTTKHAAILADQLRRTVVMFVELHKAFELKPPTNLSQAVSEYDSVFHECRTTSNWSPEKVETFCKTLDHQRINPSHGNDSHREDFTSYRPLPVENILESRNHLPVNDLDTSRREQVLHKVRVAWDDGNLKAGQSPPPPPQPPAQPQPQPSRPPSPSHLAEPSSPLYLRLRKSLPQISGRRRKGSVPVPSTSQSTSASSNLPSMTPLSRAHTSPTIVTQSTVPLPVSNAKPVETSTPIRSPSLPRAQPTVPIRDSQGSTFSAPVLSVREHGYLFRRPRSRSSSCSSFQSAHSQYSNNLEERQSRQLSPSRYTVVVAHSPSRRPRGETANVYRRLEEDGETL